MKMNRTLVAILGASMFIAGCDILPEDIWPTLTGDEPERPPPPRIVVVPANAPTAPTPGAPAAGAIVAAPAPLAPAPRAFAQAPSLPPLPRGASVTGTFVGAKAIEHRAELDTLKGRIGQTSQRFQQLRAVTEQNSQR